MFADPAFADFSQEIGLASLGASDQDIERLARCYWYSVEFGLLREEGALKAYGAGLLSSFGELGRFAKEEELRPFDIEEIVEHDYDPTDYQSVLYVVDDIAMASEQIERWVRRRAA